MGRTPVQSEIKNWLQDPAFADKSLTGEEWKSLTSQFQGSPEYQNLRAPAKGSTHAPTQNPVRDLSYKPSNPNPETPEAAIKYLYQTQLGRTPVDTEVSTWMQDPAFADTSLSSEEWTTLRSKFQGSPEYASLRR